MPDLLSSGTVVPYLSNSGHALLADEIVRVNFRADVRMMSILDRKEITSLVDMVGTTKESVHLFKHVTFGFRDART